MKHYPPSIIIPAHNEEAVILRTLRAVLDGASVGEFEVIVVCNGCSDRTAELVRTNFADVCVLEINPASKTDALNVGIAAARGSILLLDADIELTTTAARALFQALRRPGVDAAIGHMDIDTAGASGWVRAFYRVWLEHPYLINGKFAAAVALSASVVRRIGVIPSVIADDTYLRRVIPAQRVTVLNEVRFLVRVPRKVATLVRVRSRVYQGTSLLAEHAPLSNSERRAEARGLLRRVARKPYLWTSLPVYVVVTLVAKCMAAATTTVDWHRDLTTRQAQSEGLG